MSGAARSADSVRGWPQARSLGWDNHGASPISAVVTVGEGTGLVVLGSGLTCGTRAGATTPGSARIRLCPTPVSLDDAGTVTHAVTRKRTASAAPIANRRGLGAGSRQWPGSRRARKAAGVAVAGFPPCAAQASAVAHPVRVTLNKALWLRCG